MDTKDFVDFLRDKVPQIQKEFKNLGCLTIMILLTPKRALHCLNGSFGAAS